MMEPWLWLGLFILVAYTVEAVTGFGSIVIALSLGTLMLPMSEVLVVLVPLNIFMSGYLTLRHRRFIHKPTLLRVILPLMAAGTLAGYLLRPALGDTVSKMLFGVLIIWFASRELWLMCRAQAREAHPRWLTRLLVGGAGVTHGLFASGGPLLVYALAGASLDKARFRATLVCVWFCLNSLLTLVFLLDGSLLPALPRVLWYMPLLVAGVVLGEWLHRHTHEQRFRQIVYVLLLFTGASLIVAGSR